MKRTMVITGASRGIGAATAELAAGRGWELALTYRSDSAAVDAVADLCRARGAPTRTFQLDVSDEDAVVAVFDAIGAVDCLVNNAGVLFEQGRLEDMTAERVRTVFEVNVVGAFVCAREAVRRMSTERGGRGGSIVNVSSAASILGSPNEYIDYAASKGAIDTLTVGLAKEVAAEGIRVNAVRPGLIETGIHAAGGEPGRVARLAPTVPMGRGGRADEVAATILFLASDDASYVTGALLNVSGGR